MMSHQCTYATNDAYKAMFYVNGHNRIQMQMNAGVTIIVGLKCEG